MRCGARASTRTHEDLRPEDVHLVTLPLFHTNAQAYSVLAMLVGGRDRGGAAALFGEPLLAGVARGTLHLGLGGAVCVNAR